MDKQTILDRLDIKSFYSSEIPSLKSNGSSMGQALCPFHSDTKPSLSVDLKTGGFRCFGCDAKGSVFDFVMKKNSLDFSGAKALLAKEAGLTEIKSKTITGKEIRRLTLRDGYKFLRMHTYKKGNPQFKKAIFKNEAGDKQGLFFTLSDENKDLYAWGRQSRPVLYNEDLLSERPGDPVYLSESEKDADILTEKGLLCVSPGGANSLSSSALIEPLKGREVVILPHRDEAGDTFSRKAIELLSGKAKTIKCLDPSTWGDHKGADVADWLQAGGTREKLLELTEKTAEWILEEPRSLLSSLLKWNDILSLDVHIEYMLEKLIPKGSITMLFGRGGIGKTSLCLQLSRAIAEGIPFAELQTIKTPVYYIDFENPLAVLKDRVERIGNSENIYVWHLSLDPQPPKLDSMGWELYKQLPPGLLIYDTMRAANQSDEDKSKETAIVMSRMKELREAGNTIIFLQHTPKGNEGIYKGSTAWLDLADHVLSIEEIRGNEDEHIEFHKENLYRFGVRIKTRYEPHHIFLRFNPDIKGFEIAKDPDVEILEAIQELLSDKDELNTNQVYELVKKELDIKGKAQVLRLLKKGEGAYWDSEKKGRAVFYRSKVQPIYSETIRPIDDNGLKESNHESSQRLASPIKSYSPDMSQTDKTDIKNDRCFDCMLTPGQRTLCEVVKPCPKGA